MKLRFEGKGSVLIQGVPKEFKQGDTIDLPDDVAKELMTKNTDFKPVEPVKTKPKRIKLGGND